MAVRPPPDDGGQAAGERPTTAADREAGTPRLLGSNLRTLGVGQVVVRVSGFAVVILLARELGRADFGRYTVAIAVATILMLFIELGMGGYLVRETAREPGLLARMLGHVVVLRVGLGVLAVAVAAGFGAVMGYDETTLIALVLLAAAALLRVIASSYFSALQAIERAPDSAATQAQQALLMTIAVAVALVLGAGLIEVSLVILAASAITPPWAWLRLRMRWGRGANLTVSGIGATLAGSAVFSVGQGLQSAHTYLDSVMIHGFEGNVATGVYGAAYRILVGLTMIPAIYVDAATRSAAHLARADRPRMVQLYSHATAHMTMLSLPLSAGIAILAEPLLDLLYTKQYVGAADALALLMPGAAFALPSWVALMSMYALRKERPAALVFLAAVTLNAAANFALIPALGIEGAALTNSLSTGFVLLSLTLLLRREGVRADPVKGVLKPAVACAAMAAVMWLLRGLPLIVPAVAGAAVYLAGLAALRAVGPEDRELVRELLSRRLPDAHARQGG